VSKDTTLAGGNLPCVIPALKSLARSDQTTESSDTQISAQITVMNQFYAPAGITWVLAGITRTLNANWFNNAGPSTSQQTAMKAALKVGGANTLNIYTVGYVHKP